MTLTHPLGMQLYSGRKFPPVEGQLATIASCGYTNVETFGPFYDDVAATRKLVDAHGLSVKSAHFSVEMLETDPARALDLAKALGVEIAIAPYLPPPTRPTTLGGYKDLGECLARISDRFAANGLRFGWHNHDFEFHALEDGSYPIEHILGDGLLWEADLAWIVRGGSDPKLWIERYSGRMPIVHVKDIAPAGSNTDEDGWADVGAGTLPWADLWRQCVASGSELMIAEHDNPSDFARFARVSADAMRSFNQGVR